LNVLCRQSRCASGRIQVDGLLSIVIQAVESTEFVSHCLPAYKDRGLRHLLSFNKPSIGDVN